ncbi:conserved hypothetical protein [Ricinus communis]|uniref:Uncharacterized protein n=1 Tax=Ricinus communis TaxID=3988 RepID=B9T1D7_RICCO|nr:conserved hypothetical protein [Ricinus communis]
MVRKNQNRYECKTLELVFLGQERLLLTILIPVPRIPSKSLLYNKVLRTSDCGHLRTTPSFKAFFQTYQEVAYSYNTGLYQQTQAQRVGRAADEIATPPIMCQAKGQY